MLRKQPREESVLFLALACSLILGFRVSQRLRDRLIVSSMNPNAAPYIPLSKSQSDEEGQGFTTSVKDERTGNTVFCAEISHEKGSNSLRRNKASVDSVSHGNEKQYPKGLTENQFLDEEAEMDLAYMQMIFPFLSIESLSDVYLVNQGDLEATVDMLNQLESTADASENYSNSLVIGDMSEFGLSAETARKSKVAANEASSSAVI